MPQRSRAVRGGQPVRRLQPTRLVRDDYAGLKAAMREYGYVFLPGLLPPSQVAEVAGRLASILCKGGWVEDTGFTVRRRFQLHHPPRLMSPRLYAEMQSCEALHSLVRHHLIRMAVEAVLGPALVHPQVLLRAYRPIHAGGPADPAVHRDYPSWRIPDMLTIWIPLTECSPARGGLCILEGSHRGIIDVPSALSGDGWASAHYRTGDVLIFHCYTVHGTLQNASGAARISADSRWQSAAEDVPAWACEPDGGSDWMSYTQGWKNPSLVELPSSARRSSDTKPWGQLTALPPSRLLGDPSKR
jgi:Phytanoyl-CoA dioxygenase (PhyH)